MKIILKGNPRSTQWAYAQSGKIRFMKKEARDLKNSYILQARMQYKGEPLKTPLSAYIRVYFGDKRVRDWDNYHKLSMDALTGIAYEDDSQIKLATIQIMEVDKKDPRIEIIIDELD